MNHKERMAWKYAGNKGNITLPFVPASEYINLVENDPIKQK